MKRLRLFLVGLLVFTIFVGCSSEKKNVPAYLVGVEGVVVDKEFSKGYTTTSLIPSGNTLIPLINHRSDRWYLLVEYTLDGETETVRYEVSEDIYVSLSVGDIYVYVE